MANRRSQYRTSAFRGIMALFALCLLLVAVPDARIHADEVPFPFCPGERLTFRVKWAFITAGEAVLQTLAVETLKGVPCYHFVMTAKSAPVVDLFYKVQARIDAYTDTAMTHSIFYREKKTGERQKDVVLDFDWEKNEGYYSNFGVKSDPLPLLPGSFDPLSVFYAFRLSDLKKGLELTRTITDGKKCVVGDAKVVRRESIKVGDRTYDTFLVEPDVEDIGGVFKKSKNAKLQIWVTADTRRIPVRVRSKISIGTVVAELVSSETPGHGQAP